MTPGRVLAVGLDLVELDRLRRPHERFGDRFVGRFCRPGEVETRHGGALLQHLGGLFAAKEAVLKALGTGWAQGLGFRDVEVLRDGTGAPSVRLHGAAARRAEGMGVSRIHLSITHERAFAAAVAVLESDDPGGLETGP